MMRVPAMSTLRYQQQVLVICVLAIFMTIIDGTMVNVALSTMAKDFGVEASEVEWIAVGYLLAVATVIPAAGWLGDRFGTKRIFLAVGLVMVAGIFVSWLVRDEDVAETRGLAAVPARAGT